MAVDETTVLVITCDNKDACPGHPELDPNERTGWLFVNAEVYGMPVVQYVYGSADCVAVDIAADSAAWGKNPNLAPVTP